ncbi:MAG TPA: hypothetical protein ENG47_05195, partial [Candidatus Aerophobetes bacterium]|nr:hypothetical protein [Candidatus Aerophobetes bacterium]
MEAFYRLTKAGKVRFIGASNYPAWWLEEARWISKTVDHFLQRLRRKKIEII